MARAAEGVQGAFASAPKAAAYIAPKRLAVPTPAVFSVLSQALICRGATAGPPVCRPSAPPNYFLARGAEMMLCCPAMAMRAEPLNLKFAVTNFGPLASAEIDLRPLTIFVGPSNTGKSYMAILIYAFLRSWENLHYFRSSRFDLKALQKEDLDRFKGDSEKLHGILENMKQSVMLSDFPVLSQSGLRNMLRDQEFLGALLSRGLEECFDIDLLGHLIRANSDIQPMAIRASRSRNNKPFWCFSISAKAREFSCNGSISEFPVFESVERRFETNIRSRDRKRMSSFIERSFINPEKESRHFSAYEMAFLFEDYLKGVLLDFGDVHYLPAARSGIMQAHRVITSALVARSVRAGFERIQLPTLSSVVADFLQKIIFYKEETRGIRWGARWGSPFGQERKKLARVANSMENDILSGKIRAEFSSTLDYPSFVYRPNGVKQDIGLARTSSMVAELAPIILFVRGYVSHGDVLIIEEPEAHLHPAAQTKLAAVLAELIRNDVKVIITTHSEWLLQEISNLMREGQLQGEASKSGEPSSPVLRPEEVGAWLFRPGKGDSGSTVQELTFDAIAGISPPDYEYVDMALYNRSAKLQDQLQNRNHQPGSDCEDDIQGKGKP